MKVVGTGHTFVYHLVLYIHILGAMGLVAGVLMAGLVLIRARRATLASEVVALLGLAPVAVLLVVSGGFIAGIAGLILVSLGKFGWSSGWVIGAIVTYVLVLVLGALGGGAPKRARLLAGTLGDGAVTEELHSLLWDVKSRVYNDGALLLMVVLVGIMVFKP